MSRQRGFTLIELLVVIAIIAILAGMLFPVFARAREAARKIQCLSNVKNIAMAIQMYLTDYEALWPYEHRQEVMDGFHELRPCAWSGGIQGRVTNMNPYLKSPAILEEYIKNRDVWRCPSSRTATHYGILNPLGGDWWARVAEVPVDRWGCFGIGACAGGPFPPGWGGGITDSIAQCTSAVGGAGTDASIGAFIQQIAATALRETKTSQMTDPARWFVVGETGNYPEAASPFDLAYGDWMGYCGATAGSIECCGGSWVDWDNCSFSRDCGADPHMDFSNLETRKQYSPPRHMGGANIGFADGHAQWWSAEAILNASPDDPSRHWVFCCYGDPAVWDARQKRENLLLGFANGICNFWGDFGLPKGP